MGNSVKGIITSIIITIVLVVISIPLWNLSSAKEENLIADYDNNLTPSVHPGTFPQLIIISDEYAIDNIEPTNLTIKNREETNREYSLIFLVDKKSTIDYKFLRVSIDNTIYNLNDLEMTSDKDNYYFTLYTNYLSPYEEIKVSARIWINNKITDVSKDAYLTTNFLTK